jgi:BTB/POZ domain
VSGEHSIVVRMVPQGGSLTPRSHAAAAVVHDAVVFFGGDNAGGAVPRIESLQLATVESAAAAAAAPPTKIVNVGSPPGLRGFFGSASFSDVAVLAGDRRIPAHRVILAMHSPVFARMLESPMSEGLAGAEIRLGDTPPAVRCPGLSRSNMCVLEFSNTPSRALAMGCTKSFCQVSIRGPA